MVKSKISPGIEREHVLRAIVDFRAGVDHGFGKSIKYDLVHDGERFPPKGIVGLAAKHATGQHLTPKDFSGGEASICFRLLRSLGFTVEPKPGVGAKSAAKDWTEIECYFAVWGYDQLKLDRDMQKKAVYVDLGGLLGRTPKSVQFKIQDVSACDARLRSEKPISEPPRKQDLLQQVFDGYWSDRGTARAREPEMRELLKFPAASLPPWSRKGSGLSAAAIYIEEGSSAMTTTRTRTRSRQLLEMGREYFRAQDPDGKLRCQGCGYVTPEECADEREIVQLHHTRPLADADESGHKISLKEALEYLLPLCPNCHALAHTAKPPLDLDAVSRLANNR